MKFKHLLTLAGLLWSVILPALDFSEADKLFIYDADIPACKASLSNLLKASRTDAERAEVLWREARLMHSQEKFKEGRELADAAVKADPKNPYTHMWHCICYGWECKASGSLSKMAGCVPVMLGDIDTILEDLGHKNFSRAWHAKGEIYFNHPFKSKAQAEEYIRKSIATKTKGEPYMASYILLSQIVATKDKKAAENVLQEAKAKYLAESIHTAEDKKEFEKIK